jgi:hypothetical protein
MNRFIQSAVLAMLLGAAAFASGCSSLSADLCDLKCDCEGCSDNQRDECVVEEDARADQSDVYDCADLHDDYVQCVVDNPVCDAADFRDPDACRTAKERRDNCEGDRSVRIDLRAP